MHGAPLPFGLTNDAFGDMLAKTDWDNLERYDYIKRMCLGETTAEVFLDQALRFVAAWPRLKPP